MPIGGDPSRPHDVEYTGGEAKHQKHNEPPRRYPQPAVDQPAKPSAHEHACDQFGRQPETAGEGRSVGHRTRTGVAFGRPAHSVEPFAETLEPRGESSFLVRRFSAFAFTSRAVSHAHRLA